MNKQSHFEPKATLRAASAFDAISRSQYSKGNIQWSEVSLLIGFYPLISYVITFPKHLDRFYGERPVLYLFDHPLEVVKGPL
jgi:hypothetical protein